MKLRTCVLSHAAALGAGAALTYWLERDAGRGGRNVGGTRSPRATAARGVSGGGLVQAIGGWLRAAAVVPSEQVLVERVRARLQRSVRHPGAIEVQAAGSTITLSGPVLYGERDEALRAAWRTPGVRSVADRLELREAPTDVIARSQEGPPELSAGALARRRPWPRPAPVSAALLGLGLGALGVRLPGASGLVFAGLALAGPAVDLLRRALRRPGAVPGAARGRVIEVKSAIALRASVEEVFELWRHLENLPRFLRHVRSVQRWPDSSRSHWVLAGPAGGELTCDVELTELEPNRLLAWRTVPGAPVEHTGIVRFAPQGPGSMRLQVHLGLHVAGPARALVTGLLGPHPQRQLAADLRRLRTLLDEGRAAAPLAPSPALP